MSDTNWASELSALAIQEIPQQEISPVQSELLRLTGNSDQVIAAGFLEQGRRRIQIQIHCVHAGRYNMPNYIAVAVIPTNAVQGNAKIRGGQIYTFKRFLMDAPAWQKLLMFIFLPLGIVVMLPGYLLVLSLVLLAKRSNGIKDFTSFASDSTFRSNYTVDSTSEEEAKKALPDQLPSALVASDFPGLVQLQPGRVILERRLVQNDLFHEFVNKTVPTIAASVP